MMTMLPDKCHCVWPMSLCKPPASVDPVSVHPQDSDFHWVYSRLKSHRECVLTWFVLAEHGWLLAASVQIRILILNLCSARVQKIQITAALNVSVFIKTLSLYIFLYIILIKWQSLVLTHPPGASWLHLIHINCVISSTTKCVKLDISCHTLYLDLPGTRTIKWMKWEMTVRFE